VEAVPGVWIKKSALKAALVGRSANSDSAVARIGGRRLGPYEVLQASHHPQGESTARDYLLLRPAAGEAAAGLPHTPDAAELAAAAAAASDESEEEAEGGPPEAAAAAPHAPAAFRQQGPSAAAADGAPPLPTAPTASAHALLPPELASALAAIPPPGPGDTTPKERRVLLRGALPAAALPTPAPLLMPTAWVARTGREEGEFKAACTIVRLLRVRPLACLPAGAALAGLAIVSSLTAPTVCFH